MLLTIRKMRTGIISVRLSCHLDMDIRDNVESNFFFFFSSFLSMSKSEDSDEINKHVTPVNNNKTYAV